MMRLIAGTIKQHIQIAQLKREVKSAPTNDSNRLPSLRSLLTAGKRLTPEEKEYLRKHDPSLYHKAVSIEEEQRAFKRAMERARTKEDVKRLHLAKVGQYAGDISSIKKSGAPSSAQGEAVFYTGARSAATNETYREFKSNVKYSKLPTEQELREKERIRKILDDRARERIKKLRYIKKRS